MNVVVYKDDANLFKNELFYCPTVVLIFKFFFKKG